MTTELHACVERSAAAERAGDVDAALEWHQAVPMFRKGRHRSILRGLQHLGDALPEWVWARWIVYQSLRCEDGETGRLAKQLAHAITEAVHPDLLEACFVANGDPVKVLARTLGESWVFHQLAPFEGGVMSSFIDEFAVGRLAEHAELARRWATAPLRGYQLLESTSSGRLIVRGARGGDGIEVLDLGARSCAADGWVLGRLVPSGVGDAVMFDSPPLAVSERVARRAADHEGSAWFEVLVRALAAGRLCSQDLMREDYELTTDVMELELLRFGTPARDRARVLQQLRDGRDEIGRAAYRVLERARRGEVAALDQAYVAAALLNVRAFDEMRAQLERTKDAGCLADWVERVPEPASSRLGVLFA